eukprot:2689047-Rhodomonas_salina.1
MLRPFTRGEGPTFPPPLAPTAAGLLHSVPAPSTPTTSARPATSTPNPPSAGTTGAQPPPFLAPSALL